MPPSEAKLATEMVGLEPVELRRAVDAALRRLEDGQGALSAPRRRPWSKPFDTAGYCRGVLWTVQMYVEITVDL